MDLLALSVLGRQLRQTAPVRLRMPFITFIYPAPGAGAVLFSPHRWESLGLAVPIRNFGPNCYLVTMRFDFCIPARGANVPHTRTGFTK
jgi:hypothetical protein